jgi:putative ABC transport system permease protein
MHRLRQNVRLGLRSLRRAPGFALTAVATLAVGIGLSTAVFTVADALLLRPLPVVAQDRLVVLSGQMPERQVDSWPLTLGDAREFARRTRAVAGVAWASYYGATPQAVREGDRLWRLQRAQVSGDFFAVLDARPIMGRALRPEDDVFGAAPVLVLSHRGWQERFGGAADVVGRQVVMHADGVAYTVVGVMPQGLDYPRGTDAWASVLASTPPDAEGFAVVDLVGRLAPGATVAAAREELTAYFQRPDAPPPLRTLRGRARTLPELVLGDTRTPVLAFAAASTLLLLITCINVASLLLVRGLGRVREVAVRSALGAGRGQVVAQLLVEHAILAVVGGLLGLLVAAGAVRAFVALAPPGLPRVDEIGLDATTLAGAVAITAVALLLFALAPALVTARAALPDVLRSGTRQSAGRRFRLATEALVVGQVALALVVLAAAGLLARSFVRLQQAELSFQPSRLLVAELALRADRYGTPDAQRALLDQLLPRVQATPGVVSVTPVVAVPFSGTHGWDGRPAAEGQTPEEASTNPMLNMEVVAPGYFAAFGIPVLRGRAFTDADREGAPPVVVISESTARHYWPGEDPIGRRLRMGPPSAPALTVAGLVPDTRWRDLREARPSIYFPLRQSFFPFTPTTLAIRTSGPSAELVPALRRVLAEAVPGVALASAVPFETYLERPLAQPRLNALLLAVFAGAALLLAAVGLFGVMATMVRQRTRELGVRMALGATAAAVARLVLRRGMALAAAGTALGLLGALAANRLLAAMLFDVSPSDAATLAAVAALLLVVAALASLLPARSSARIEPVVALREE